MRTIFLLVWLGVALLSVGEAQAQRPTFRKPPGIEVVRLPKGGVVPDVALDAKGVLHVVFGFETDAYYMQVAGKERGRPVRLNKRMGTVTVGGERGPKIALGKGGVIHVLWQGHYQKGGGVWYTQSKNGGKSFASERNLLDKKVGVDEPTLTADSEGNVIALWLDGRLPETPENKVASPIFMARSRDNGATFGKNIPLNLQFPGRACACCALWSRILGKELVIAFRTGYRDIRDIYLLRGAKTGNDFRVTRVSEDNWEYNACPMSGPRFSPGSEGLLVAWMSRKKVYWTQATGDGFRPRIALPEGSDGDYPNIVANRQGQILFLWTREGQAYWALYDPQTFLLETPEPMNMTEGGAVAGRPALTVRPNGHFVVVL